MSKRHLKLMIRDLAVQYSKSQQLYEKCADSLSDNLISPDIYESFCKIKNKLDEELHAWSEILNISLERKKFLQYFSKVKDNCNFYDKLLQDLENDPSASDEYKDGMRSQAQKIKDIQKIYLVTERVSSLKDSSIQKNLYNFSKIKKILNDLNRFYLENLEVDEDGAQIINSY